MSVSTPGTGKIRNYEKVLRAGLLAVTFAEPDQIVDTGHGIRRMLGLMPSDVSPCLMSTVGFLMIMLCLELKTVRELHFPKSIFI